MEKIKSLFTAIGITLIGIAMVLLIPIFIAIASVLLTAVSIIGCLALVYILVEDEKQSKAITHERDEGT